MPPDPTKKVLILARQTHDTWNTSLPVGGHTPHVNLTTLTNDKARKQAGASMAESFVWRPSIRTAAVGEKLGCRTEGFSDADLDFNSFGVPLAASLALCIVAG